MKTMATKISMKEMMKVNGGGPGRTNSLTLADGVANIGSFVITHSSVAPAALAVTGFILEDGPRA